MLFLGVLIKNGGLMNHNVIFSPLKTEHYLSWGKTAVKLEGWCDSQKLLRDDNCGT